MSDFDNLLYLILKKFSNSICILKIENANMSFDMFAFFDFGYKGVTPAVSSPKHLHSFLPNYMPIK